MKKDLYILRGIPGCGKTTVASEIADGGVVCCADDYFTDSEGVYNWYPEGIKHAHAESQNKCMQAMLNGDERIVVANTNTTVKEMKPYTEMAEKYGYRVFSLVVENRHGGVNVHGVPKETLANMKNRFVVKL